MIASGQNFPEFKVKALKVDGKESKRTNKMKRALKIFEKVMNDAEFQNELQKLNFQSDREDDPFKNLTTQQVLKKIYAAKEHYSSDDNNTADIYWITKRRSFFSRFTECSVLGYGNEDKSEIYSYTCFTDNNEIEELVGHIAHEWTHKLGFVHAFEDNSKRDYTVSYSFGNLVTKHSEKYLTEN